MLSLSPRLKKGLSAFRKQEDPTGAGAAEPHWSQSQEAEEKEKETEKQKICLCHNINMTHKRVMLITIEQL